MILRYCKKGIFKVLAILTVFAVTAPASLSAELIILNDGTKIEDDIIRMDESTIHLKKGGELKRDSVKDIYFSTAEKKEQKSDVKVDKEEIDAILKEAEEFEKKFPTYNGLVLLDEGYHKYNEDGTNIYRYHYRYKILKDVKKSEANATFYFNEGRERINVLLARTISKDGEVFNLDPEKIKISKPGSGGRSFSRYQTLTFVLPNAQVGSILEYHIEVDNYNPFEKKFFFPQFGFYGADPTKLSRVTITVPKDVELFYVLDNFDEDKKRPEIKETDKDKSYSWEYRDIEPIIYEAGMPAYKDVVPYLTASLFKEWDTFFDWVSGFIEKKIVVTDAIKEKVAFLTKGLTDDEDKVAKIYHYIQKEIRYISIKSGIGSGYSGHPAAETLKNEYGDCIDKAILFTTMLKVLDIESYPIILKTNDGNDMERRLPGFDSNHAITKVVLKYREFFLDSTAENYRYPYFQTADHGIWVINPLEHKLEYIYTPPPKDNANISIYDCNLNASGDLEIDSTSSYTGASESNTRYYVSHVKENDLIRYITNYINSLSPGSQLKYISTMNADDFSKPFSLDMGYILKNYGISAGDLIILSIPGIERSFPETALAERKYPLEFTSSSQDKKVYNIDLTGSYTVKYLPEPLHIDTDYFSYDMEYSEKDGKIIFTEDYQRKRRVVPVDEYEEYKEAHKEIERRLKDKIFLTRVKSDAG